MRISTRALALTVGLVWGGGIAFVGLVHLAVPAYGTTFLELTSSIYPGFHGARNLGDALIGIVWGFADGAGGGLICGWLYNLLAGQPVAPARPV